MSLLRMPKFQRVSNSWESVVDFFSGRCGRSTKGGRPRRLMLDPLEQRTLLSLTVGNVDDQLVNQTTGVQFSSQGQSVATDDDGDFVVVWQRNDPVLYHADPNNPAPALINPSTGLPYQENERIIDPRTGGYMVDYNIYASYFTDEVQRVVLPEAIFNGGSSQPAKFSLVYGGNAIQKISITATNPLAGTTTAPDAGVADGLS